MKSSNLPKTKNLGKKRKKESLNLPNRKPWKGSIGREKRQNVVKSGNWRNEKLETNRREKNEKTRKR